MNENAGTPPEPRELKICSKCRSPKPPSEFNKDKGTKNGLACQCKTCARAAQKKYRREHRQKCLTAGRKNYRKNRTKIAAATQKYYRKNRTERIAQKTRYYVANRESIKDKHLQQALGITLADSTAVQLYQQNKCGICGRLLTRACNDHDHKTGLYRGCLCWNCNTGLGKFADSIERLLQVLDYLTRPPAVIALGQAKFGLPGRINTSRKRRLKLAQKTAQVFSACDIRDLLDQIRKRLTIIAQLHNVS